MCFAIAGGEIGPCDNGALCVFVDLFPPGIVGDIESDILWREFASERFENPVIVRSFNPDEWFTCFDSQTQRVKEIGFVHR